MRMAAAQVEGMPRITCTLPGDSTRSFGLGESTISPLFCVNDPEASQFGLFAHTQQVAVARKATRECTSWYIALPGKDIEPLRSILRQSQAHAYVSAGEIVYAGGGVLGIHMKDGGKHQVVLRDGRKLTFDLPEGAATLLLDAKTGKSILE